MGTFVAILLLKGAKRLDVSQLMAQMAVEKTCFCMLLGVYSIPPKTPFSKPKSDATSTITPSLGKRQLFP